MLSHHPPIARWGTIVAFHKPFPCPIVNLRAVSSDEGVIVQRKSEFNQARSQDISAELRDDIAPIRRLDVGAEFGGASRGVVRIHIVCATRQYEAIAGGGTRCGRRGQRGRREWGQLILHPFDDHLCSGDRCASCQSSQQ